MQPDALDTLDAIMAGLHTLAGHAESVAEEQLRNRLTGTIVGLRAGVLTARDQVLHLQGEVERARSNAPSPIEDPARRTPPASAPRLKWGCYQFPDAEGLFCAACWDKRQRRVRTMRHNNDTLVCPNCRTLFPHR